MEKIVLFPGRFQPFHKGHKKIYESLLKKFDKENIFILTSDKIDNVKNFLNFEQRKSYILKSIDISESNIIKVTQPYKAKEIIDILNLNSSDIQLYYIYGNKDKNRLQPNTILKNGKMSYFITESYGINYKSNEHGYVIESKNYKYANQIINASAIRKFILNESINYKHKLLFWKKVTLLTQKELDEFMKIIGER